MKTIIFVLIDKQFHKTSYGAGIIAASVVIFVLIVLAIVAVILYKRQQRRKAATTVTPDPMIRAVCSLIDHAHDFISTKFATIISFTRDALLCFIESCQKDD